MTHGRKPRKPRAVDPFTFGTALHKAARLTPAEVATTIAPARACATLLSQGVATEDQHTVLHTAFHVALAIEDSGIVRASGRKWVVSLLDPWPFPGTEAKMMELTVDYTDLEVVA